MNKFKSQKVHIWPSFMFELSDRTTRELQEIKGYADSVIPYGTPLPHWEWIVEDERLSPRAAQEIAHYISKTKWLMNCKEYNDADGKDVSAGCPYCDEISAELRQKMVLDQQTYGPYTRSKRAERKKVFVPYFIEWGKDKDGQEED